MKVESKNIVDMLNEIKSLLSGIEEIFQYGEYVEEGINQMADNVKAVIAAFTIEHMTPQKKDAFQKEHSFLKRYDVLSDAKDYLNPAEYLEYFKAKFYLYLKREVRTVELPINVNKDQLILFIEDNIVMNGPMKYAITSSEFDRSAYGILTLIASEILEYRRKNPQIVMELAPAPVSKKLIDLI